MRGWLPSSGASELKSVKRDEQRCDESFIANKKMAPLCMGCRSGNMSVLVLYKCIGPFVHFMVCWHIYWFTYIVFVSYVLVIMHLY